MERSTELQNVIKNWFESVVNADASWLDRHVSADAHLRIVGTDPNEWLQGTAGVDLLRADLAALGGKATVEVRDVEAYTEGSIGWGVARPEITLGDNMKVSPRWSAVFRREDGEWKAIQIHASFGVSNEAAFGTEAAEVFSPSS